MIGFLKKLFGVRPTPRDALIRKARTQGWRPADWRHKDPLPVVSLEDFFTANEDRYSIAANLEPHPGLDFMRSALLAIRARPDVQEVLVEITDLSEDGHSDEVWPYSGRVYILTSASEETAAEWNRQLMADGPVEGWAAKAPPAAPRLRT